MTLQPLLDFIGKHESRGDYNVVHSKIKKTLLPTRPITKMTIGEVLKWQDFVVANGAPSSAAGKWQVIRKTLRATYPKAGLNVNSLYDAAGQEAIAVTLLKGRGLDRYMAGQMTTEEFCNALAREWASLPIVSGPRAGRSAYDGDGLNKSRVDVGQFMAAVEAIRSVREKTPVQPQPRETPTLPPAAKKPGPVGLVATIVAILGGVALVWDKIAAWFGG